MKSIIKKVGISIFAMILVSSILVIGKGQNVFADGEEFTVNFHYSRSDANYSGYTIKAYSITDSEGKSGTFTVNGNEGVFTYTFTRDAEIDDQIRLLIRTSDSQITEIDSNIDISGVTSNTIDVAINGESKSVEIMEAGQTTSPEPTVTPTVTGNESNAEDTTQKPLVPDDPNADYSVSIVMVIIIDVVFLVIVGGASFLVLGKEKKVAIIK